MPNKKRVYTFSKKVIITGIGFSTVLWSIGFPVFIPVVHATAPIINTVQYLSPTAFKVRFNQTMNTATIVAGSFSLHTEATDTETISSIVTMDDGGMTAAIVIANGAKITPSFTDWVRVACNSEANVPQNGGAEANVDCGNIGLIMPQGPIVISEVKFAGSSETDEFIEIYNRTGSAVDAANYKLTYLSQDGTTTDLVTFTGADAAHMQGKTSIPAGGFRLIGPTGTASADATYTASGNGIETNGTVVLYQPVGGGIFMTTDMVGCGLAAIKEGTSATCPLANSSLERKASPTSTAVDLAAGGAHVNWGNGNDSNNNSFDFVTQATPNLQNSTSTAETPGGGGYTNQSPNIDHMPISQVVEGQDVNISAMMSDAETPQNALVANLIYSKNGGTTWTTITGQYMAGQPFKFTIPAAEVGTGAGEAFRYYLKATDADGAYIYMWSPNNRGANETTAKAGAFVVTRTSGGSWTNQLKGRVVIAGTDTGIDNVSITLRGGGGLTFNANSTTVGAAGGCFTFNQIPAGMFRVEASAPGYMMGWMDGIPSKASGTANYTDWVLGLTAGSGGGQGGDTNSPMVMFSAPMEGMMGAPIRINILEGGGMEAPIMVGFSKDMDSTTINSTNIKIKKVSPDGSLTEVTGISVAYQPQNGSVTLADRNNTSVGTTQFGPDRKAILYSATALTTNSQYVIELSPAVKDTAGNPLQGNKPGGGQTISFGTGGDFTTMNQSQMTSAMNTFIGGSGGGGQYAPPYVMGSTPQNGAKNVPTNVKIIVNFSQPMDSTGINITNSAGTYVKLYDTNYNNTGTGQYITLSSVTLDSNTRQFVTITPATALSASHSNYAIRVLGGVKSSTGMTMAMPGQENTVMYQADFSTGSGADSTAPTVQATTLGTYSAVTPCSYSVCVSGVSINAGVIGVNFSKDMDSSTITTSNITLKTGTTTVNTTVSYDSMNRSAKIMPSTILYNTTTYILTITTGAKAMNGIALAADYTISFVTSSDVDSTAPTVQFANGDDYRLSITFSEPMQAAKATDTNNWAASVLNPANYILYMDNNPPPTGSTALYFSNTNLSTATDAAHGGPLTFQYDPSYSTVLIEGLKMMDSSLTIKGGFRVWVSNVKDLSGNQIQATSTPPNQFGSNSAGGGVMNSSSTFGMVGPGGGGMSGPPTTDALSGGTMAVTSFGGKDPSMMGFKPINVFPTNMLAGQESLYMIDIPLSQVIPASGQIVLTFPVGFDVTNATDADPNKLWAHKDLNGPGIGTVTIASISANATARTVTIALSSTATQSTDFLHMEIDRIKNTTQATDANIGAGTTMGSGYQVDILTKTSAATGSRTLETLKSMPFFIKSAGTNTLTGTITFKDASGNNTAITISNLPIYLMSPMTGPLKTLVSLSNEATKTYTFSNLPTGMYGLGTEPLQTISNADYYADLNPMPQPIEVASGTNTKNITFQAQSNANKPSLTVYITGTFSNEQIDIFAGGPTGFSVKTVTLNGTFTNSSPSTQTFYLPGTGTWMIGMGPAMPRGPQQAGPPPMPNWMPPKGIEVTASGSGGSWTWIDDDGAADLDASATDGEITFGVTSANKTISGHVYAPAGTTGIQNAEVYAYSPMGGMGSHATTGADGSFSLKVTDGSYNVGSFVPGMPPSPEISVEVKTVGGTTTIYANGVATTDVIIRIQNPESMYTISGKVTDGTNVIKDASVYARRTDGPGNVGTKTDSMGKYILYVTVGTWTVGVFLPQYGNLTEQTVTIATASEADIDFSPAAATTFYTVKDRVYKDVDNSGTYTAGDTLLSNVHIDYTKTGYHNGTMSQDGSYTIKVPAGTYTVTAWSPDVGKIPVQTVVVSADITNNGTADLPVPDTKTVTVNFIDSNGDPVILDKVYVQMDKLGTKDVSNEESRDKTSSLSFSLPSGTNYQYALDIDIPGIDDTTLNVSGATNGIVTANDINSDGTTDIYQAKVENNITLNVTVPTLYTVTGTATDDSGNVLPDTVINIKKAGSEVATSVQTDSSGNYSVSLPASGSNPYLFQIDKAGYIDTSISVPVTNNTTQALDGVKSTLTIEGQIKIGNAGVSGAKVYAKELGGGFASTETDAQGNYVLPVAAGNWKVSATSDSYQEKEYQNASNQDIVLSMSSTNQTGINITLASAKTGLAGLNNADITPSSGGTFEDTSASLEIIAPQNSIATSQSTYQMEDIEVSNVSSTPTSKTIGGEAIELKTYEPSGSSMMPKNTFSDDVAIVKQYALAELTTEGIDTFAEAEKVKMSYFDESASNWEPVLTTITYLDSNEAPVIPTSNLSNVSYVMYSGVSDHMTVYSPTNQTPDGLAPSAPTSLTATGTTSGITVTWTAPTTNADATTLTDLLGYEIYRATSSGGTYSQINASDVLVATYNDTSAVSGATYYYKVTAADTGGIESAMSSASNGAARTTEGGGGGGVLVWTPQPTPTPTPSPTPTTPTATPVSNMTVAELQAEIARILSLITQLQAELNNLTVAPTITGVPTTFKFKLMLKPNQISLDVKYLQIVLNSDSATRIAASGVGSPGEETNIFGSLTKAAVIKFQEKYKSEILAPLGLTAGTGIVGSATIAKLNQLLGK